MRNPTRNCGEEVEGPCGDKRGQLEREGRQRRNRKSLRKFPQEGKPSIESICRWRATQEAWPKTRQVFLPSRPMTAQREIKGRVPGQRLMWTGREVCVGVCVKG